MQGGGDRGCRGMHCVCITKTDKVRMPRHTRISQSRIDVFFCPVLQIADVQVCGAIRKLTHILLQCSIHQIEATNQELRVVIWGGDVKPWVGAPGWISDEVGE